MTTRWPSQKLIVGLWTGVVILLSGVGCYSLPKNGPTVSSTKNSSSIATTTTSTMIDGLVSDTTNQVGVVVPKGLTVKTSINNILISHVVPFVHPDPCDFKGDAPDLKTVTDLGLEITLVPKNFFTTVAQFEGDDFAKQHVTSTNHLELVDDFIETSTIGGRPGYRLTMGVEGCGYYRYYLSINENKTVVIRRPFISELKEVANSPETIKTILALPGIISSSAEEKYVAAILASLQISP